MLAVGVLYLGLERNVEERKNITSNDTSKSFRSSFSRNVLGVQVRLLATMLPEVHADTFQVGLIVLAMIVTTSSVASLQARQGLPLGAQIVGWIVLGKKFSILS
jgi:phosphatidylinositol glycan class N